ncbi:hypothetical protein F5I97DRAFT_1803877 [Phlebopus sp. FC_14]|nr:hypothetical protein F5I97DRAFT_1803877 [Phlebopus sp. FC_14]
MPTLNYVEPPNSNLICCICRAPFSNPATTTTCMHTFCYDCVVEAVRHSPQCPVDRSYLSLDVLVPANPIVKHLVDELIVECPQRAVGCTHTCQRQLLQSHLNDVCQYVTLPCSEKDCDQSNHYSECSSKTAKCSSCSSDFPRSQTQDHVATCPEVQVPCTQSDKGCPWTGPRRELSKSHILSCPYESMKGYFTINNARLSSLTAENACLRQRIQALEGMVQTMQREMRSLKTVLGPWYQSEIHRTNRSASVHGSAYYQENNPQGHASTSTPPNQVPITDAIDTLFPPAHPGADALAPYFPDAGYGSEPYIHTQTRRPSSGILDVHTHQRSLPLSPVAPLNLSTSLEGSLNGLRESIVAVSASVDSLARRNDIALTNESMRINEELGSLKYVVHGIRLQLHRVMMDRNAQVTGRMGEPSSTPTPVPVPAPAGVTIPPQPVVFHPPMMTQPFPGPTGTKL